jgi:hypothetical protein
LRLRQPNGIALGIPPHFRGGTYNQRTLQTNSKTPHKHYKNRSFLGKFGGLKRQK